MDKFQEFQTAYDGKEKTAQDQKDDKIITKYLSEKNITAKQDTSGLRYVIHANKGGIKTNR